MKKVILTLVAICATIAAVAGTPKVHYKGNVTIGSSFGTATVTEKNYGEVYTSNRAIFAPELETVHGVQFGKCFFLGAGTGFKYEYCADSYYDISAGFIPLYAALKAYIPVTRFVAPYVMCDLGYGFCIFNKAGGEKYSPYSKPLGGFSAKAGIGIEIDTFVIALGYNYQGLDFKANYPAIPNLTVGANSFFIKLGIAF